MTKKEIIELIDKDIDKHYSKASEMMGSVNAVLTVTLFILVIYFIPDVAIRMLPNLQKEQLENTKKLTELISVYKEKYNEDYMYISGDEYENYVNNNTITNKIRESRKISKEKEKEKSLFLKFIKFASEFKTESKKIEFVLKIIPLVLGSIIAGFLITYRLHIISAKDLASKKINILLETSESKSDIDNT